MDRHHMHRRRGGIPGSTLSHGFIFANVRLRAAAKVTQTKYGRSNQLARGVTRLKETMVKRIAPQSSKMSAKANQGLWSAKNNPDQATLSVSCPAKIASGMAAPAKPCLRHTSQAAIAMQR